MGNLDKIISLQALLKGRYSDFDNTPDSEIQLIRHADKRVEKSSKHGDSAELKIDGKPVPAGVSNLYELYLFHRDLFEKYQSEQLKGRFDKTKYWVVFLGESGTTSRFVGVYEIIGRKPSPHKENEVVLEFRHVPEFQFLEEKIIIDWKKNTQSWHQYYNNEKDVIRIEEGMTKDNGTPVFKDYLDVILDYNHLLMVIKDPDWQDRLKALNCIYQIVDKSNGKIYVGSTSGHERIFGRWCKYAKDGHGGNVKLMELISSDSKYHEKNFQWSILETLRSNITQNEAIERENLWKRKFLSLKHGYNKN